MAAKATTKFTLIPNMKPTIHEASKTNKPVAIAIQKSFENRSLLLVYGGESHHGVYLDSKHEADNTWSKQNKQASGYRHSKIVWESISSVSLWRQKPPWWLPWFQTWRNVGATIQTCECGIKRHHFEQFIYILIHWFCFHVFGFVVHCTGIISLGTMGAHQP